MKHARRLRQQLDDWQQVWRQVDGMVDRLETAREEDDSPRRRTEALLLAAGVLERHGVLTAAGGTQLSDPVVTTVPTSGADRSSGATVPVDAWAPTTRGARLPGTDELELAVADLETVSLPPPFQSSDPLVLESVRLLPSRATLDVELDGVVQPLRVPSYPGGDAPIAPPTSVDLKDVGSLFPPDKRVEAATHDDTGEDPPPEFVATWSALALARRAAPPDPLPPLTSSRPTAAAPPVSAAMRAEAADLVADVVDGMPLRLPFGRHVPAALGLATAARAAAAPSPDADDLRAAATLLEEEGVDGPDDDLADTLGAAADVVGGAPDAWLAVADAAQALAGALSGPPLGSPVPAATAQERRRLALELDAALDDVPSGGSTLLLVPPELGAVGHELDVLVGARLAYPDGSLRLLRTLERAFARWWPTVLRWMVVRSHPGGAFDRALQRATQPFVDSLAALVAGGDPGLGVEGLTLAAPASVGVTQLLTDAPASLVPVVSRTVEVGQVVLVQGPRPGAAVVLGLDSDQDRLTLRTTTLRVSLTPTDPPTGTPGLVAAGAELGGTTGGLTATELRRGLADDGARDALVEQALALHGQLALLRGTATLQARLGGVQVPPPSGPSLDSVTWHGEVPARTAAFVLHGAPDAWWEQVHDVPRPTLVRSGELVLLRGDLPPDPEGAGGGPSQTVLEVDRAVRLPAAMLARTDLTRAAVLATDPAVLGGIGEPTLLCGPQEDLVLMTVRRTWQSAALVGPVTLRRDFAGFDLASLAVGTPLGDTLVTTVTGGPPPGPTGVERVTELAAAVGLLEEWTRSAR